MEDFRYMIWVLFFGVERILGDILVKRGVKVVNGYVGIFYIVS